MQDNRKNNWLGSLKYKNNSLKKSCQIRDKILLELREYTFINKQKLPQGFIELWVKFEKSNNKLEIKKNKELLVTKKELNSLKIESILFLFLNSLLLTLALLFSSLFFLMNYYIQSNAFRDRIEKAKKEMQVSEIEFKND